MSSVPSVMDAVICRGFGEASVSEVPVPDVGDHDVLIDVRRVQLSVTECNLYRGEEIAHYEAVKTRIESGDGRVFGHEFCGEVVAVGDRVTAFDPGDRVYAPGKISCGECEYCRSNRELYCSNKTYIGYDIPGALAEYAVLPAAPLCLVPDDVTDAEATALQPLASSVLCVEEAEIGTGDVVAVIGTGVMGSQCAQLARLHGADEVIAIDVATEKLEIAEGFGLTTVDASRVDAVETVVELTGGVGADVVIEAVGGNQSHGTKGADPLAQASRMVTKGGRIVQVGYIIGDVTVTPRTFRTNSVDWVNPVTGVRPLGAGRTTGTFSARLVSDGRVSIDEYITHELDGLSSFEEAVEITLDKHEHGALGPAQIIL